MLGVKRCATNGAHDGLVGNLLFVNQSKGIGTIFLKHGAHCVYKPLAGHNFAVGKKLHDLSAVAALDMQPRVAQHAATALSAVCDGVANSPSSELLQPYLEVLLNKLLDCAQRMGSASNQLRESAAYALMSLIACAGPGSEELLVGFYQFVLQQSENVLAGQAPGSDMEQAFLLQRFYCIALVALLERLKNLMKIEVDRIATLALRVGEKAESEA